MCHMYHSEPAEHQNQRENTRGSEMKNRIDFRGVTVGLTRMSQQWQSKVWDCGKSSSVCSTIIFAILEFYTIFVRIEWELLLWEPLGASPPLALVSARPLIPEYLQKEDTSGTLAYGVRGYLWLRSCRLSSHWFVLNEATFALHYLLIRPGLNPRTLTEL